MEAPLEVAADTAPAPKSAAPAAAEPPPPPDACAAELGKVLKLQTFDAVVPTLPRLKPKSEFETTSSYESRRAVTDAKAPARFLLAENVSLKDSLSYNADSGTFTLSEYTLNQGPDVYIEATLHSKYYEPVLGLPVRFSTAELGSYTGVNGFGGPVLVKKQALTTRAVLKPNASLAPLPLDASVRTFQMAPAQAAGFKSKARVAYYLKPVPPYFLSGAFRTLEGKWDARVNYTFIVADVPCGLLLGPDNKAVFAFPIGAE
jgi:hypothetical protein